MDLPFEEGNVSFSIPSIEKPCFTYYRVYGDLSNGRPPVICSHSGPGAGHGMFLDFAQISSLYGFPVVFYDPIGSGRSTHLDEKAGDQSFWQMSLFVAELKNLVGHFNLISERGFYLLGINLGAMLNLDYATCHPQGLRGLILGSPAASFQSFIQSVAMRRGELPQKTQDALHRAAEQQNFDTCEWQEASRMYFNHFLIRKTPLPKIFEAHFSGPPPPNVVRDAMVGSCPLGTIKGSLHDWDITEQLHRVSAPALVWTGEFDQTNDICVQPLFEQISHVRWYTFPGAGSIITWESDELRAACLKLIGDFLSQTETHDTLIIDSMPSNT